MSDTVDLKVILSELQLIKQSIENIEVKLKMKEPEKSVQIPATVTKETKDYLEITELPAGTLTIRQICEKIDENKTNEVCDSKKKIAIYGQLLSLTPGGTGFKSGRTFPAKIVFVDDGLRKFQGVVWSKSKEEILSKLVGHKLVLSKVYFKLVKEEFIDEQFMLFESGDGKDQFQFHANDFEISVFKRGGN